MQMFSMHHLSIFWLPFSVLINFQLSTHQVKSNTSGHQTGNSETIFNPFPQDTIYHCGEDTVLLDAGPGYDSYVWNTGDTAQNIQAAKTGKYIVGVVDKADSILYDTVFVSVIRFNMDAFSIHNEPFLQNFDSVSDKTLLISLQYPFNRETILYNNKGSIWVANEDCSIDSITFSILSYSPYSSTEPSYGILTVYDVDGDPLNGTNLIMGTYYWAVKEPGLVTLPVSLYLRKGKTYQFNFGKGPQATQSFFSNTATLRAGEVDGFSSITNYNQHTYDSLPFGVWIKLQGKQTSFYESGNAIFSCFNNPVILNVNGSNYKYVWSTESETRSIKVTPNFDTTISLHISNSYHACRDSAIIDLFNVPFNPFSGDSIFACDYSSFPLHAKTTGYTYYTWNTGSNDTSIIANTDAWYKVVAEGGRNCLATDSVYVTVIMPAKKSYRFIGNGLYSDPENWEVQGVTRPGKPPTIIGPHESIYIDPSGVCIMDVQQTISDCSDFTIRPNAKLIMQSTLIIKK